MWLRKTSIRSTSDAQKTRESHLRGKRPSRAAFANDAGTCARSRDTMRQRPERAQRRVWPAKAHHKRKATLPPMLRANGQHPTSRTQMDETPRPTKTDSGAAFGPRRLCRIVSTLLAWHEAQPTRCPVRSTRCWRFTTVCCLASRCRRARRSNLHAMPLALACTQCLRTSLLQVRCARG